MCVCVCVANFTNKHMILNVVLVIKSYLECELILSNCIISYSEAAWSSVLHLCVKLGCCYNYYELCLFLCVFTVSTAAVYCALSVNMPVDLCLYTLVSSSSSSSFFFYIYFIFRSIFIYASFYIFFLCGFSFFVTVHKWIACHQTLILMFWCFLMVFFMLFWMVKTIFEYVH